jgi:hypothetical protein
MKLHKLAIALLITSSMSGASNAQTGSKAILLEPLSDDGIDRIIVRNVYGKCGSLVVQVLGVRDEDNDFFSVDGNADIVVIREGGRQQVSLKRYMSDYNGVACVGSNLQKRVLVWSDCAGTACGNGYSFTVVDPSNLRILAGGAAPCDAACAAKITGSRIPSSLAR